MAAAGFATPSSKRKKKTPSKVKSTAPELSQSFRDVLPGELAVAVPLALAKVGIKDFEKTVSTVQGMFGVEMIPFVTHQVGVPGTEEEVEIPWGRWSVPGLGEIEAQQEHYEPHRSRLVGYQADKEDDVADLWKAIVVAVKEVTPSITLFKGRAFQVRSPQDLITPRYIDLTREVPFFVNDEVMDEIDLQIFSVLRNREALKEAGVRMKRGIALEGNYGSGKTLLAYLTAKAAVDFNQTFIMCSAGLALKGYHVALNKQPSVLFIEDLDSNASGNRDHLNGLLNTLSGVETKGDINLMLLVSTNFLDRIDPAFLRPERLGAIIPMALPNEVTIGKILRSSLKDSVEAHSEEEWGALCASLVGATPAIVAEVAERGKIHAVRSGAKIHISRLHDLVSRMQRQRDLSIPVFKGDTDAEQLASSLASVINSR